ncbi:MAG: hypothetical protein IPO37_04995 [Saprospiraceae bacterium]|nr:hypothetical protein [Saprospiraceae bacterium]
MTTVSSDGSTVNATASNDGPLTCTKTSVTLTATGGGSYVWSGGGTSSTKVVTTPGTYTVTVTSSNGCTAASSTTVTQNITTPSVTATNDGPLTCTKTSVTLSATGNGTYLWSGGGTSSTKVVTIPGTYTVTVTSSNGCITSASTTVTQNITPPSITATNDGPLTCSISSVTLTATGGGTYAWSGGGTGATKVVTAPGTYTVTVTSANGCTATAATNVISNGSSITGNSIITSTFSICRYEPITIIGSTPVPAGGAYSWELNLYGSGFSVVPGENSKDYHMDISDLGSIQLRRKYTVGSCFTYSPVLNGIIKPTPNVQISAPSTICYGQNATLEATGAQSYIWFDAQSNQIVGYGNTYTTPNLYSGKAYAVTGTSNGCEGWDSRWVEVSNISASISGPTQVCPGQTASLTASGGPDAFWYKWNTGSTSQTIAITSAGTYTVTVSNYSKTCSATATHTVTFTPPTVTATNDGPLTCAKSNVTLTATGGGTYLWSGGGTSPTKVVSSSGTYTVTVTGENGCTASASTVVTQNFTVPSVSASNDGPITCNKASVTLTASGGGTYVWTGGGTSPTKVVFSSGTYTVTVTGENGCTASASTVVTQNFTVPSVSASNDGPITCNKASVTLTASGGGTYVWTGGGTSPTKVVSSSGTYTVTVTGEKWMYSFCINIGDPKLYRTKRIRFQ